MLFMLTVGQSEVEMEVFLEEVVNAEVKESVLIAKLLMLGLPSR